jgi:hypothetical protein
MTHPEFTLKKKHNVINYHQCHEAIAAGCIWAAWINCTDNLTDALTKVTAGERRRYFFSSILWWQNPLPLTSRQKFYGDRGYQTGGIPE